MLTGTPLQNDLVELHNLLSFLLPGLFKDSQENEDQNFGELRRCCLTGSVLWFWVVQNAGCGLANLFVGSALCRGAGRTCMPGSVWTACCGRLQQVCHLCAVSVLSSTLGCLVLQMTCSCVLAPTLRLSSS